MSTGFKIGKKSAQVLDEVHDDLALLATHALLEESKYDIGFNCGIRSQHEQNSRFASGVSKTTNSRHLPRVTKKKPIYPRDNSRIERKEPVSHAIDIGAVKNLLPNMTREQTDREVCLKFADAMRLACNKYKISCIWGGSWCDLLYMKTYEELEESVNVYIARCKKEKKKPLVDMFHFNLTWLDYPVVPV